MLSSDAITDCVWKPSFGARAPIHLRVRTAVLPDCNINAPKRRRTAKASDGGTKFVILPTSKVDVTRIVPRLRTQTLLADRRIFCLGHVRVLKRAKGMEGS